MKPVLKRSHMKQPKRRDCSCRCHMLQEPLKMFQWNHSPAHERIQAVQHRLSTIGCETCCQVDRVQLHAEKRDPLHRESLLLFQLTRSPRWLRCWSTRSLYSHHEWACIHNRKWASISQSSRMRTLCSLIRTRATSTTFMKTRGDRESPKRRTLY